MGQNYKLESDSKTSDWFSNLACRNVLLVHVRALLRRSVQQTRFNLPRFLFEGTPQCVEFIGKLQACWPSR
jgi:hypothetical protein